MKTPLHILVAEDDLGDVWLLQRAFIKAGVSAPVYFAADGQEVLDYLEGEPPFDNPVRYPLPDLLLLDLKLPRVSGFEVLTRVRSHSTLSQMLVVILSSSNHRDEMERAEALGANSYIVKPQDPTKLVQIVKSLQEYWLGIDASDGEGEEILSRPVPDSAVSQHLRFDLVDRSAALFHVGGGV